MEDIIGLKNQIHDSGRRELTIVQGPSVAPGVKSGCCIEAIEAGGYIGDDPEYKPDGRIRLTHRHCYVLARQAKSSHPNEIYHPIHRESAFAI